jgi:hypothetical protein
VSDLDLLLKRLVNRRVEFVLVGDYKAVLAESGDLGLGFGHCRVLSLDALIRCKVALDRPRDREAVVQLRTIRERVFARSPPRKRAPP